VINYGEKIMNFLNRLAAAQHLNERGIAASKTTLARMAMHGEGPQYVIIRQRAYYKPEWLDAWLDKAEPSASALEHMTREGS
jgi:hypothetical protein